MFLRLLWLSIRLFFDRRVSIFKKFIPILTALYILSPLDFLPDALPFVGVLDDFGLFVLGLDMFIRSTRSQVLDHHLQALGLAPAPADDSQEQGRR